MATWKSIEKVEYLQDTGLDYVKTKKSWEYNTTSDILTILTEMGEYYDYGGKVEASENRELLGKSESLGLLESLIDWAETFEGEGTVEKLLKQRLKNIDAR